MEVSLRLLRLSTRFLVRPHVDNEPGHRWWKRVKKTRRNVYYVHDFDSGIIAGDSTVIMSASQTITIVCGNKDTQWEIPGAIVQNGGVEGG